MSHQKENSFNFLLPSKDVYHFILKALKKVGTNEKIALNTAKSIWLASLRGVDTHGIKLLPHYLKAVQKGRINPNPVFDFSQNALSAGILDANHTFGHAAGYEAMHQAEKIAEKSGIGIVVVKNSSHCGALAPYALEAANKGMIGFATTHTSSLLKSTNSMRTYFGSNPLCFTAPMADEPPFCFDASVSMIPRHKLKHAQESNRSLPASAAADEVGRETTDPQKAFQLLPIGDHKGYGLAMVVDILCGLLTGMAVGPHITDTYKDPLHEKRELGHMFGALKIDAFENLNTFSKRLQAVAEEIRKEPPVSLDKPVMVPGDPEKANQIHREKNGIPISNKAYQQLQSLASQLNLPFINTPPK